MDIKKYGLSYFGKSALTDACGTLTSPICDPLADYGY